MTERVIGKRGRDGRGTGEPCNEPIAQLDGCLVVAIVGTQQRDLHHAGAHAVGPRRRARNVAAKLDAWQLHAPWSSLECGGEHGLESGAEARLEACGRELEHDALWRGGRWPRRWWR